jgi:phosphatidylglycerol:prolipoprotein diacylglycerol transferase
MLGTVIGGRLGQVIFYEPSYYAAHPLEIIAIWEGGMSFHGGLIGVLLAIWYFAYRLKISFLTIADVVATICPLGIFLVRIGNFHQLGALGPSDRRALGRRVSRGRRSTAPSQPVV